MNTPRYSQYLEYKQACEQAFEASGLGKVHVTADAGEIMSASRHGVLIFPPPELTFPTYEMHEVAWEAIAIAGPADDLEHAWRTLDSMLEALIQANLDMRGATPDSFTVHGSPALPGYLITFNSRTVYKETP